MVNIDYLLLTVFAVQHSVMARRRFKERWPQIVPWGIERSTFVLLASLALLLLFWHWRPMGIEIWTIRNPAVQGRDVVPLPNGLDHDPHRHASNQPL